MNKKLDIKKGAAASQQELFNPDFWKSLAADMLREAQRLGASSAEVEMSVGKGFTVSSRLGEVETVEYNQGKSIDVSVYFGKRSGTASIADTRWESILSAIQAACHIARYTQEDPCSGLAEPSLLAFNYPELELSFPWNITVDQAIDMACQCEKEALAMDKRVVNSEGASLSTHEGWYLYANSDDFMGYYGGSTHEMSCVLVGKQKKEMQRDYSYTTACDPSLLVPVSTLAKEAVQRTVDRLGSRRLATQKAPVIFIAEEARGLLGSFTAAIAGGSLFRKSSFLLDQLGKPVFPSFVRLDERPHLARSVASLPFDDDGVMTRNNVFVEDGILQSYALGVYSARQLGMQTTANAGGIHNLFITTGKHDLAGLLKKMGKGLLVTEVMGPGVNIVTGDYSRGAAGFWVENGEIQYPVSEITIASNLKDMYAHIVDIATDVDTRGNIRTGSILIEEMMIAGD